jgi:hypothetical protein
MIFRRHELRVGEQSYPQPHFLQACAPEAGSNSKTTVSKGSWGYLRCEKTGLEGSLPAQFTVGNQDQAGAANTAPVCVPWHQKRLKEEMGLPAAGNSAAKPGRQRAGKNGFNRADLPGP